MSIPMTNNLTGETVNVAKYVTEEGKRAWEERQKKELLTGKRTLFGLLHVIMTRSERLQNIFH
jgi:hypothetical protein